MIVKCIICGKILDTKKDNVDIKICKGVSLPACGKEDQFPYSECQKKRFGKAMRIGRVIKEKLEEELQDITEYIERLEQEEY